MSSNELTENEKDIYDSVCELVAEVQDEYDSQGEDNPDPLSVTDIGSEKIEDDPIWAYEKMIGLLDIVERLTK